MINLPTRNGYIVSVATGEKSARTGRELYRYVLTTTDQEEAERVSKELREKGENVKVWEAII